MEQSIQMIDVLMYYGIGIVFGLYCAWFEYFITKTKMDTKNYFEALIVCTFAWYVIAPWVIGDFIYQRFKRRFKWKYQQNNVN